MVGERFTPSRAESLGWLEFRGALQVNGKVTLLAATFFLVATLSNLANARNSPNIFYVST